MGGIWLFIAGFLALWYFLFRKPSSVNTCMTCGTSAPKLNEFRPAIPLRVSAQLGSPQTMYDNFGNLICPTGWHADTDPLTGNPVCVQDNVPVQSKITQSVDPCSSPQTWTAAQCVNGPVAGTSSLSGQ